MWLPPLRRGVDCVCGTEQGREEDAVRALLVSVDCNAAGLDEVLHFYRTSALLVKNEGVQATS